VSAAKSLQTAFERRLIPLITFGGKTKKGEPTNAMLHFRILRNTAAQFVGDSPPRIHHSAVMYLHYVIVYGGEQGGAVFSDIWVYEIDTERWKAVAGTFPRRTRQRAVVIGTWMLVIGGHDDTTKFDNPIFGIDLRSWALQPFVPLGNCFARMAGHAACAAGDRIFVFGGYESGKDNPFSGKPVKLFNTFLVMDIPEMILESCGELPELRIPEAVGDPRRRTLTRRRSMTLSMLWAAPADRPTAAPSARLRRLTTDV
jgi:hypothetical protein